MAKYNKDTQARIDALKQQEVLQNNLSKSLQGLIDAQAGSADAAQKIVDKMNLQKDASSKLTVILAEKQKILEGEYGLNKIQAILMLKKLEDSEKLAKIDIKRQKSAEYQKELLNDRQKTLNNILGLDDDIANAVARGGVAALAMNKAFENVGTSLTAHVDTMKQMVTQQGLSGKEAFALKGNIDQASMSFTGLLYGSDALAASATAITEKFGNVNAATSDMIKGVTEVASLTGDAASATDLVVAFQAAGVEAGDVSDHIQAIAEKHGVSAKKMLEGMTSQTHRLKSASKEQLDSILSTNAALIKQGTNMDSINATADSMLDIESSLKASAKARVMLGRDINDSAVRAAALEMKSARGGAARDAAKLKMSQAILDGVGGQEQFDLMSDTELDSLSAAYGMTTDQLTTQMHNKKVQDELTASYGKYAGFVEGAQGFLFSSAKMAGDMALEMVKVVAKTAIMNMMMGKGSGIGGFFQKGIDGAKSFAKGLKSPLKSLGALKDKVVAAFKGKAPDMKKEMLPDKKKITESVDNGGKASGKGGMKDKLKDMAEGLKAMGDGKVFAGIGAVALAGPAFIIALPSIPFLLFMGKVKLKQLEDNFTGLATGLNSMSTTFMGSLAMGAFGIAAIPSILSIPFLLFMGKVSLKNLATNFIQLGVGLQIMSSTFMGSLALAAFGVAALIAIPSLIFLAGIALLGAVGATGLIALGGGLEALGGVAATGLPFLAIAAIAGLGIAMIPFAYALSLVTPLVEAFGNIFIGVFAAIPPIITAVADGFVNMMNAVTMENVGAMLLLGPALMGVAFGLAAIGFLGVPGLLALAGLGAVTVLLAPSLMGIADSIGDMMSGDSDESDTDDGNSALITEIKALGKELIGMRGDIQSQPILINVDGKVVSKISRVQSRQVSSKNGFGG